MPTNLSRVSIAPQASKHPCRGNQPTSAACTASKKTARTCVPGKSHKRTTNMGHKYVLLSVMRLVPFASRHPRRFGFLPTSIFDYVVCTQRPKRTFRAAASPQQASPIPHPSVSAQLPIASRHRVPNQGIPRGMPTSLPKGHPNPRRVGIGLRL